jgi:hypothetical protein
LDGDLVVEDPFGSGEDATSGLLIIIRQRVALAKLNASWSAENDTELPSGIASKISTAVWFAVLTVVAIAAGTSIMPRPKVGAGAALSSNHLELWRLPRKLAPVGMLSSASPEPC